MEERREIVDDTDDPLKFFGLSFYHINVYRALLAKGEMSARPLSKASGVPYTRIYEIINELIDMGFITKDLRAKPTTYGAYPPTHTLLHLAKAEKTKMQEAFKSIFSGITEVVQKKMYTSETTVNWIERRDDTASKVESLVGSAKSEIKASLTLKRDPVTGKSPFGILEALTKASISHDDGKIEILFAGSSDTMKADLFVKDISRRFGKRVTFYPTKTVFSMGVFIDRSSFLLALPDEAPSMSPVVGKMMGEVSLFVEDDPKATGLILRFFEKLKSLSTEVIVGGTF